MNLTEAELLERFAEIAAIRQFDGGMTKQAAERAAYYCWRREVGKVVVPEVIRELVIGKWRP